MAGCGEIDIFEYSAYCGNTYSMAEHFFDSTNTSVHTQKSSTSGTLDFNPTEQFAEYACAWREDGNFYYCNGELVFHTTDIVSVGSPANREGRKSYMILSLGMYPPENTWCGPFNFVDEDFPIALEVEYVRVYK